MRGTLRFAVWSTFVIGAAAFSLHHAVSFYDYNVDRMKAVSFSLSTHVPHCRLFRNHCPGARSFQNMATIRNSLAHSTVCELGGFNSNSSTSSDATNAANVPNYASAAASQDSSTRSQTSRTQDVNSNRISPTQPNRPESRSLLRRPTARLQKLKDLLTKKEALETLAVAELSLKLDLSGLGEGSTDESASGGGMKHLATIDYNRIDRRLQSSILAVSSLSEGTSAVLPSSEVEILSRRLFEMRAQVCPEPHVGSCGEIHFSSTEKHCRWRLPSVYLPD
jgi:hypothetical protein